MRSARPLMSPAAPAFRPNPKPAHRRALVSSASTLAGFGAGLTAAATAAAQSQTDIDFGGDGSGIIIGQTLLGAVHSHQSGLTHSHNPLTQSPIGPNHAHSFPTPTGIAAPGGALVPGPFAAPPPPVTVPAVADAVLPQLPVAMPVPAPISVPAPVAVSTAKEPILIAGPAPVLATSLAPETALAPVPASVSTSYASATPIPINIDGADHGLLALGLGGLAGLAATLSLFPSNWSSRLDGSGSNNGLGYNPRGVEDDDFFADGEAPRFTSGNVIKVEEGKTGVFATVTAVDPELAILDSGSDQVRIYDLQDNFTSATLLFTLDAEDSAEVILGLPVWYELASVEQGNLADDLLIGGGSGATVYYDETAL